MSAVETATSLLIPFAWWQVILILLAAGFVVAGLLLLLNKISGGNFSIFKILSVRKKKKKENDGKEKDNLIHIHKSNLEYTITKIIDYAILIHDLKTRGILSTQMLKAEEFLLNLKNISLSTFSATLKEKDINIPPVHHADYLNYKATLQECFLNMKDIIRSACIKNGFDDMGSYDYGEYIIKDIIPRIESAIETFISENYITWKKIPPEEIMTMKLKGENRLLSEKYRYSFKNLFQVMRTLSKKKNEEVKELQKQKRELYEKELGIKFDKNETET